MTESLEQLTFEKALAELTSIVETLESGTLDLDETVTHYQRGRCLAAHCQHLLDEVEVRVQQLAPDGQEATSLDVEV
jgi:exodeoxyribonuclease VII small subunit